jgi:hypothetical protein
VNASENRESNESAEFFTDWGRAEGFMNFAY